MKNRDEQLMQLRKIPGNDKYECTIIDESTMTKHIESLLTTVYGDILDTTNASVKIELFEHILKVEILRAIKHYNIQIDSDKPYVINMKYLDTPYNFIIANISKKDIGTGYTIAKTLQS